MSSPAPRPARIMRILGLSEIALGLALLIAGFAADVMLLVIIGAVFVASSGTLLVLSRTMARQGSGPTSGPGAGYGGDQPPPRWPPE